jgi:hypothetical protein
MQVRIYGQRKMQTLRDIASASGQQNNALRLAQLAGKIDCVDFAGSGHGRILWVKRLSAHGSFSNPQMTIKKPYKSTT